MSEIMYVSENDDAIYVRCISYIFPRGVLWLLPIPAVGPAYAERISFTTQPPVSWSLLGSRDKRSACPCDGIDIEEPSSGALPRRAGALALHCSIISIICLGFCESQHLSGCLPSGRVSQIIYVSEIDDAIHFRCISYMFPDGSIPAKADDHPRGVFWLLS